MRSQHQRGVTPHGESMPIKASYASLDEVPETYRDLFEERDGGYHLTRIEGLVTTADVQRVKTALDSERNLHKSTKEQLKGLLGERKLEEVQAMLDKLPELEAAAAGKLDETKLNELVEGRLRTRTAPLEREKQQLAAKAQELEQLVETFKQRETQRTIGDAVRAAALKAKVLDTAQEDVLLLAERVFEVTEEGKVVARDGAPGAQPGLSPEAWLMDMQTKRPHWWPASTGGGARGGSAGGVGGANPWSADGWNMTEQMRLYRENPQRAEQLAKAAGTTIGGARPVKK